MNMFKRDDTMIDHVVSLPPLRPNQYVSKQKPANKEIIHPDRSNQTTNEPNRQGRRSGKSQKTGFQKQSSRNTQEHNNMKYKRRRVVLRKQRRLSRRINRGK